MRYAAAYTIRHTSRASRCFRSRHNQSSSSSSLSDSVPSSSLARSAARNSSKPWPRAQRRQPELSRPSPVVVSGLDFAPSAERPPPTAAAPARRGAPGKSPRAGSRRGRPAQSVCHSHTHKLSKCVRMQCMCVRNVIYVFNVHIFLCMHVSLYMCMHLRKKNACMCPCMYACMYV